MNCVCITQQSLSWKLLEQTDGHGQSCVSCHISSDIVFNLMSSFDPSQFPFRCKFKKLDPFNLATRMDSRIKKELNGVINEGGTCLTVICYGHTQLDRQCCTYNIILATQFRHAGGITETRPSKLRNSSSFSKVQIILFAIVRCSYQDLNLVTDLWQLVLLATSIKTIKSGL